MTGGGDRGSAILAAALAMSVLVAAAAIGAGAQLIVGRVAAANAADAAALAAAPVTFRPFGAGGSPRDEAVRFARLNGAEVVRCVCPSDEAVRPRQVEVVVARQIDVLWFGRRTVIASSRAEFDPGALGAAYDVVSDIARS